MKLILLISIFTISYLNANEIQRIESIVQDINKLRADYNKLDDELAMSQYNLKDEKEKNIILKEEIKSLSKQLKKAKNILKIKENSIKKLTIDTHGKVNNCLKNQITISENSFPELTMKEKYKSDDTKVVYFKASAFRANKEADIYDGVDGERVDRWEVMTSFTSNQKISQWIKITGYFVDKVWRPSQKELWIKESDATQREE